jgi:hypothetical protein
VFAVLSCVLHKSEILISKGGFEVDRSLRDGHKRKKERAAKDCGVKKV